MGALATAQLALAWLDLSSLSFLADSASEEFYRHLRWQTPDSSTTIRYLGFLIFAIGLATIIFGVGRAVHWSRRARREPRFPRRAPLPARSHPGGRRESRPFSTASPRNPAPPAPIDLPAVAPGIVLRHLRGESVRSLAREVGVSPADVGAWKQVFVSAGERALRSHVPSPSKSTPTAGPV